MQYFTPDGDFFVGDCMPFFHEGTFHLFYLLDEQHHQGKGGLGGHQWAHASSTDLEHWIHHPLALAIDEEWECSISAILILPIISLAIPTSGQDKLKLCSIFPTSLRDQTTMEEPLPTISPK
jgi:hypothetical protein